MSSSNALISAPGLTEDQIQTERAWLEGYGKDVDSLDWSKWEKYWDQGIVKRNGYWGTVIQISLP
ncbi:hypothetical protein AG1IA_03555 [Rhizoctonia solani AG-1 IA]|uniref:Uncharacterized protein n=1 Tax=Thanatephorus cucumeris (strain AG1-IA) TaxID=983506 RepID=L8X1D1_THACA|nr:hypothetical protein AG1IA_03555 [Rhizoctonia solani AG-1 IA]